MRSLFSAGLAPTRLKLLSADSVLSVDIRKIRDLLGSLSEKRLFIILARNSILEVAWFLELLSSPHVVMPVDPDIAPGKFRDLVDLFKADFIVGRADNFSVKDLLAGDTVPGLGELLKISTGAEKRLHADLAMLMLTSGSTGSPKSVRLSRDNLLENARQITKSLELEASDVGVTSLPFHYAYGMSVILSHAFSGGALLVTDESVLEKQFWRNCADYGVTNFAGVPMTFKMLRRWTPKTWPHPELRFVTQAGGKLANGEVLYFHKLMASHGGKFYVMYGQTEASPRMACLPHHYLPEKLGSCGVPLDNARFVVIDPDGNSLGPNAIGEVEFCGPNVMMGYAETLEDLALGDVQGDCLRTGDIGYVDSDGFLFITGRENRFTKIAGKRYSLEGVEQIAEEISESVCACVEDSELNLHVFVENRGGLSVEVFKPELARRLGISQAHFTCHLLPAIPTLSNGKIDTQSLKASAENQQTGSHLP